MKTFVLACVRGFVPPTPAPSPASVAPPPAAPPVSPAANQTLYVKHNIVINNHSIQFFINYIIFNNFVIYYYTVKLIKHNIS